MLRKFLRVFSFVTGIVTLVLVVGGIAAGLVYVHYSHDLPDYYQLANYDPPVTTRVLAEDGRLLAEFATENRVFIPISAIPKRVINAFISAEDKSFYTHPGIDVASIMRAIATDIAHFGSDRRPIGASTITQQVTKNFLLTNEVSLERKVKEAILALRIEKVFTKDRILELYLNQIYLGAGNYGVATAALNYFDKSLDELSVAEAAYLAALPKAPNNYNAERFPNAAKARRDWVIERMREEGYISAQAAEDAKAMPLVLKKRGPEEKVDADYFAEEVRREIIARFGEQGLYQKGLTIRSSLNPHFQEIADRVFREHLVKYDRTRGYRGPLTHIAPDGNFVKHLHDLPAMPWLYGWQRAEVLETDAHIARIGLADGQTGQIPLAELTWGRRAAPNGGPLGPQVKTPADVLVPGDVVAVEPRTLDAKGKPYPPRTYTLRQVPEVSGAMAVLDPHTGRVLAMTGGWSFRLSEFNRATQAYRQPGSSFKPIVYLTGLERGLAPNTLALDAPIAIDQGPGLPLWRPENYKQEYLGVATMREGLEKSRNLMTVRFAETIGMDHISEMAQRLGVIDHMQPTLAMSLGAGETTVLRMATAYGMIVNGGKKIQASLIDRAQDNHGWTIYRSDARMCEKCQGISYDGQPPPLISDNRAQLIDPVNAYQIVSMLEGVVQRGTGTAVKAVGKPLAGKTGTTNESKEVWFVGFSPDLVAAVYLGYDTPRTLGKNATGGALSAPIFRDFMKEALADRPATPFRLPSGLRLIRIAYKTGTRAQPGDDPVIWEAFKPGTEPGDEANTKVIEGTSNYGKDAGYGTSVPVDDTGAGQDEQPGSGGGDESPAPAPSPVPSSVSPGPVSGAPPDGGIY